MPWSRPFDEPIQPPKGKALVTLKDAAASILALPKSEQQSPEWQAAGEAVIMAAEDRGPLMHARIGMLRALNRNVERMFNTSRKDTHWGKHKPGRNHPGRSGFNRLACSSEIETPFGQKRCCDDRPIRSSGSYDPALSGFSDLRCRGCRSRPGNGSPLP
jgi:hypothetical protein